MPAGAEEVGERHALNEVADQVGQGVADADFVESDDGGVAQLGDGAGLAQKAL